MRSDLEPISDKP